MKKFIKYFNIALLVLFFIPQTGLALDSNSDNTIAKEIVVYTGRNKNKVRSLNTNIKRNDSRYKNLGIYKVPASELPELKIAEQKGEIEAYSYNEQFRVALTPTDPDYGVQWAMPKIGMPSAWDVTTGSDTIKVAIIDTGFQLNHEDLTGRFITGHDFLADSPDATDPSLSDFVEICDPVQGAYYHGTLVAGVIAANFNSSGIAGMDRNAKIMPLQAMDNCGLGELYDIAAALDWATANGADIINMSLGATGGNTVLSAAINNAYNNGVTLVAATGNDNGAVLYPAAYPNVIAVGATGSGDVRSGFSNYGPQLDLVAPGESIRTTATVWNGSSYSIDDYGYASGTSLAAPFVTGAAALLKSQHDYSPDEIKTLLTQEADKVAGMGGLLFTNYYGYGRINVNSTLNGTLIPDNSKISLNSFRITMENATTPFNDTDYVLADYPAIGEPVTVRATIKNTNPFDVTLTDVRLIGVLDTGKKFTVGTTPIITIAAGASRPIPAPSFNITSFRVHSFYIDYLLNGVRKSPYVKPTYSYQKIKAHYPNVKMYRTPVFVPSSVPSYSRIIGAYKIKNYDARPAYLRAVMIRANLGTSVYYFRSVSTKINPASVYYYESSIVPYKKGIYKAYAYITYGNGSLAIPPAVGSYLNARNFTVY